MKDHPEIYLKRKFDSIKELVEWVLKYSKPGEFIFRGQVKNWQLRASLFRIQDEKVREQKYLSETALLHSWINSNKFLSPYHNNINQSLAIAQHYGFPTELIDFTWDIEVAAYFATHGKISKDGELGVIWAIDYKFLQSMYKAFKIPEETYEVKGLWRLENQKGIFIRDVPEVIQLAIGSSDFSFKHINSYETERINRSFIYPKSNELEREIQRFDLIKNRHNFRIFIDTLPKNNYVELEAPEDQKHLIHVSSKKYWNSLEDWKVINPKDYNNGYLKTNKNKYIIRTDFYKPSYCVSNVELLTEMVSKYRNYYISQKEIPFLKLKIDRKNEIELKIAKEFSKLAIEVMFTLLNYPYSDENIAFTLQTLLSYISMKYLNSNRFNEWSSNEILFEELYNEKVVEIEAADKQDISTRFYVPVSYFINSKSFKKITNKLQNTFPELKSETYFIYESFKITRDFRVFFSPQEALNFWSHFVNPYQFFIRPKSSRIYNLYYVNIIGFA